MPFTLRSLDDGTVELHQYRSPSEIGFSGPIGPLPAAMIVGANTIRDLILTDYHEDAITIHVSPRFTIRGNEPVLAMWAVNDEVEGQPRLDDYANGTVDLVFLEGPNAGKVPAEKLDSHTDTPEWARRVIGLPNLETAFLGSWLACGAEAFPDFRRELERRCGEGAQAACEALDAAGVTPPILQPIAPPIAAGADGEMSDEQARELLRLLGVYFDAYPDESTGMTASDLIGDLVESLPRGLDDVLTERLSAAREH